MISFRVQFQKNGDAWLLGRLCTRDGTGAQSPDPSEGKLNKGVDFTGGTSALIVEVWDIDPSLGNPVQTLVPTAIDPAVAIHDTLQTGNEWQEPNMSDSLGGNFEYLIPASAFPTGGHLYRALVHAVTNGGGSGWGVWEGIAEPGVPLP